MISRYLKDKHGDGRNLVKKEDDDDNDSVASDEFEEMLEGMMGGKKMEELDFLDDIGDTLKKKKDTTGSREFIYNRINIDNLYLF